MEKVNINRQHPSDWEALHGEAQKVIEEIQNSRTNQIQRLELMTAFLTGEYNPSMGFLLIQARTLVKLHENSCQIVKCEAVQRFVGARAM